MARYPPMSPAASRSKAAAAAGAIAQPPLLVAAVDPLAHRIDGEDPATERIENSRGGNRAVRYIIEPSLVIGFNQFTAADGEAATQWCPGSPETSPRGWPEW
jgi:hypothetical protein